MNLLNKLATSIKFKKNSKCISKSLQKLEEDLTIFNSHLYFITHQPDDIFNRLSIRRCTTLNTDCKYTLAVIYGKLKSLKTINAKQTQQKLELNLKYNLAEIEYHKISSNYESYKLDVDSKKNNIIM